MLETGTYIGVLTENGVMMGYYIDDRGNDTSIVLFNDGSEQGGEMTVENWRIEPR